jgi:hypothetical protein
VPAAVLSDMLETMLRDFSRAGASCLSKSVQHCESGPLLTNFSVWRPIHGIVEDWPLATMSYQSIKLSEVHPTNIFRERYDFVGQTIGINYSSDQKWYYLDKQTPEDVTLIKIWDNKEDVARCKQN